MLICGVGLAFAYTACNKNNGKNSTDLIETPSSATNPDAKGPTAKIVFTETEFDFGKVTEGETVEHVFMIKNEGDADLVIKGATSSCGCTVPDPPKHPIKPGEEEKIRVTFDSKGKKRHRGKGNHRGNQCCSRCKPA